MYVAKLKLNEHAAILALYPVVTGFIVVAMVVEKI